MKDIELIYDHLLQPSDELVEDIAGLKGDILLLGAGGKMGPALAKLAAQAIKKAGIDKKVIAASRFTEKGLEDDLKKNGITTIKMDLLNDDSLMTLPAVENVLYMAGTKFGTAGKESFTWAMNSYLPGRVANKFRNSNIVVFSTGNVYHLTPLTHGGATEERIPAPVGEYAQSCLGRERIFQHFSISNNTPVLIFRLNYANDVSYGVLHEIASSVDGGKPIDLSMGNVNVIWQGDANEIALRALRHCESPAKILNVTGPETVSIRWLAGQFGRLFNKEPLFANEEQPTALLNNAAESFKIFGYPRVPLQKMVELIADWIRQGGKNLNKPTHFQERKGQY